MVGTRSPSSRRNGSTIKRSSRSPPEININIRMSSCHTKLAFGKIWSKLYLTRRLFLMTWQCFQLSRDGNWWDLNKWSMRCLIKYLQLLSWLRMASVLRCLITFGGRYKCKEGWESNWVRLATTSNTLIWEKDASPSTLMHKATIQPSCNSSDILNSRSWFPSTKPHSIISQRPRTTLL